jgi:hypothetical protein
VSFVCREFDENNTKYYRHLGFDHINVTPQYCQHPDYVLPPIEKDYFLLRDEFDDDLKKITDYAGHVAEPVELEKKPCRGWFGDKYAEIMFLSMQDCLTEQKESGKRMKAPSGSIPLTSILSDRKDYESFENDLSTSEEAVIRARECLGTSNGKLCAVCKKLSRSLAFMKRQTSPDNN